MAHKEQQIFCKNIKDKYPDFFSNKKVLDIGSLDINGSNKSYFSNCDYLGIDVGEGRNVDLVCRGHELEVPDETYDVIISTECFEHDMYYIKTIRNAGRMLKSGGLFVFTCATTGRPEHGTRRTSPSDAPLLSGEWSDYYKNLTEKDIREAIDIDLNFSEYKFDVNEKSHDLYFYGIKV